VSTPARILDYERVIKMKILARALKSLVYVQLSNMVENELSYTNRIDDEHYQDALLCLELMRAVDAGNKRITIELVNPVSKKENAGP